jgi:hypothetical protein
MALACGHLAPAYGIPLCPHLRTAPRARDYSVH